MANNLGSDASFVSSNAKPESGETIDALWGQKIADNTQYNKSEAIPLSVFENSNRGYACFIYRSSHPIIRAYWREDFAASPATFYMRLYYSGSDITVDGEAFASATFTQNTTLREVNYSDFDMSSDVSDGELVIAEWTESNFGPWMELRYGSDSDH